MKEEVEDLINSVLLHQEPQVLLPKIPIGQIIDYVTKITGVKGEVDTNGYQCDFWVYWVDKSKDINFCLSGDLWYNETHTFEIGEK